AVDVRGDVVGDVVVGVVEPEGGALNVPVQPTGGARDVPHEVGVEAVVAGGAILDADAIPGDVPHVVFLDQAVVAVVESNAPLDVVVVGFAVAGVVHLVADERELVPVRLGGGRPQEVEHGHGVAIGRVRGARRGVQGPAQLAEAGVLDID